MSGTHQRSRGNFVENTVQGLFLALERAVYAEDLAGTAGLLQRIDPRVKLTGVLALIVAATLAANLRVIAVLLVAAVSLAAVLASVRPLRAAARLDQRLYVHCRRLPSPRSSSRPASPFSACRM